MDNASIQAMLAQLTPYDLDILPLLDLLNSANPNDPNFQQLVIDAASKRNEALALQKKLTNANEIVLRPTPEILRNEPPTLKSDRARLDTLRTNLQQVNSSISLCWIGTLCLLVLGVICFCIMGGIIDVELKGETVGDICGPTSICTGCLGGIVGGMAALFDSIGVSVRKGKERDRIEQDIRNVEARISQAESQIRTAKESQQKNACDVRAATEAYNAFMK